MKVIVLGGAGAMAEVALDELRKENLDQVTIADYDKEAADAKARQLGAPFDSMFLDANDHAALVKAVAPYDVAMGFIGPFYKYERPIVQAMIEAKTHYVSIADDYDAYLATIGLYDEAEKAGITVITGLGNSPGITNILAKKGYQSMDNPKRINVNWCGGSDEAVGPANVKHVMHIFSGYTLQWMNSQEVKVKTGMGRKLVEFPQPVGTYPIFYTGHAESVSIPRNLPGLEEVTLHGGAKPAWISQLATGFGLMGFTRTPERRETMSRLLTPLLDLFAAGGVDKSVFRVDTFGTHKGLPCHNYYTGVGHIAFITSIPCVEGALMVGRNQLRKRGVFAAEAIINPDTFLPRIAKRGVELFYYEGMAEKG